MSATDHWMRFNIGDYLADTMHLNALQHGMYLLLLMHCFKHGHIPREEKICQKICHCSEYIFAKNFPIIREFFFERDGKYYHQRIDKERAHANGDGRPRARGGAPTSEPEPESPPRSPPSPGGRRAKGHSRNAAVDIIREEMEARAREH